MKPVSKAGAFLLAFAAGVYFERLATRTAESIGDRIYETHLEMARADRKKRAEEFRKAFHLTQENKGEHD